MKEARAPILIPHQVGLGLGASQGALAGFLLGLVVVWRSRPVQVTAATATPLDRAAPSVWSVRLLWIGLIGLAGLTYLGRLFDEPQPNAVRLRWQGSVLDLYNLGMHDKIATHLAAGSNQAALVPPIYLKNHASEFEIDPAHLKWIDQEGHPAVPPKPGEPIEVIVSTAFATSSEK